MHIVTEARVRELVPDFRKWNYWFTVSALGFFTA